MIVIEDLNVEQELRDWRRCTCLVVCAIHEQAQAFFDRFWLSQFPDDPMSVFFCDRNL
jgi:hypothetical protein